MKNLYFVPAFLFLTSSAFAQFPGYSYRDNYGSGSSSTTVVNYKSDYQFERERVLAMMEKRRTDRLAEWERGRMYNPIKSYSAEDRAKSKFELARQLYYLGKIEASKRWLAEIIDLYPTTAVAEKTRLVLSRF